MWVATPRGKGPAVQAEPMEEEGPATADTASAVDATVVVQNIPTGTPLVSPMRAFATRGYRAEDYDTAGLSKHHTRRTGTSSD